MIMNKCDVLCLKIQMKKSLLGSRNLKCPYMGGCMRRETKKGESKERKGEVTGQQRTCSTLKARSLKKKLYQHESRNAK